ERDRRAIRGDFRTVREIVSALTRGEVADQPEGGGYIAADRRIQLLTAVAVLLHERIGGRERDHRAVRRDRHLARSGRDQRDVALRRARGPGEGECRETNRRQGPSERAAHPCNGATQPSPRPAVKRMI